VSIPHNNGYNWPNKTLFRGSDVERVFNPDRKDTHWGKWKLKRDQ